MLATNGFRNKIIWNNNKYKKTYETIKSVPLLETVGINVPVVIGGVQIKPGDLIIGDDTGIVVIPSNKAVEVLKVAQKIQKVEEKPVKDSEIEIIKQGFSNPIGTKSISDLV